MKQLSANRMKCRSPDKSPIRVPDVTVSDLKNDVTKFYNELSALMSEIGESDKVQKQQLFQLKSSIEAICQKKIQGETARKKKLKNQVIELEKHICDLRADMELPNVEMKQSSTILEQVKQLQKVEEELEAVKDEWRVRIRVKVDQLLKLAQGLTITLPTEYCSVGKPRQSTLDSLDSKYAELVQIREERQNMIEKMRNKIIDLCNKLGISPITFMEKTIYSNVETISVDKDSIESIQKIQEDLQTQLIKRQEKRDLLLAEISKNYQLLEMGVQERSIVLEDFDDKSLKTELINKLEMEANRLTNLKRERFGELIETARNRMGALFDSMHFSPNQKSKFVNFNKSLQMIRRQNDQSFDSNEVEKLLQAMYEDINVLQERLKTLAPLYKTIEKRYKLIQERIEYNNLLNDPNRLLSRTRRGKAVQAEIKMANRIKKIPNLEEKLIESAHKWENDYKEVIMYKGKKFIDFLQEEIAEYKLKVEEAKKIKDDMKKKQKDFERRNGSRPVSSRSTFSGMRSTPKSKRIRRVQSHYPKSSSSKLFKTSSTKKIRR